MGSQAAIPFLEKQGGVIINVSSLAARCATSGRATLYGAMKAAVVNYTNTLAGKWRAKASASWHHAGFHPDALGCCHYR